MAHLQKDAHLLSPKARLSRGRLAIYAGLTALVGIVIVVVIFAATGSLAIEAENGSVGGTAKVVTAAAASGGKAVQFGDGSAATPTPTPTSGGTCPSGQVGTPPNCVPAPPLAAASGKQWTLPFNEEFNGTDYDHTKLTPCFDWNSGDCTVSFNNGKERYLASQDQVSGGTVKMVGEPLSPAYKSTACFSGSCTYKSGLLSTARPNATDGSKYLYTFTYGYVEARLKMPKTSGFFTAFWMLPANPSYTYRSEIDILENLAGDHKTMYMTYHYNNRSNSYTPNNGSGNNGACAVKDYTTDFVQMGMDWEPDHIAWYINGVKCGQFSTASQIENGPMDIIMDMMIDNDWERQFGLTLPNQTAKDQLEVDYLRVYQQK